MARNIHGNYYEDTYHKYECRGCRRCFIVGEVLSEGMKLACPYCGSSSIEWVAASSDETAEEIDMGCLGLYFSRIAPSGRSKGCGGIPLSCWSRLERLTGFG